tara:strand:- start:245 stop:442 length:198 start_codon:yes stop_codon:yes gene_type:complete
MIKEEALNSFVGRNCLITGGTGMIDISLAKDKLNFEPKVSLQDGIQKTVNWYKDYYKNSSPENKK